MQMEPNAKLTRRTVLKTTAVAGGSLLLAGCLGNSGDNNPTEGDPENTETDDVSREPSVFGDWFEDVPNYDSVVDVTDKDTITITVGAESGYTFAPPAIKVSPGTTVVWKWSGKGGSHNVIEANGAFKSDMSVEKGHTFEQPFDEKGAYRYYCEPHKAMGMKGGVLAE